MIKKRIFILSTTVLSASMLTVFPALAQEDSPLKLSAELRSQYIFEDNQDLGTADSNSVDGGTFDARIKLRYQPTNNFTAFFEASGVKVWGSASGEDENGFSQGLGRYAEWRQSWIQFDELFGQIPWSLQVGRQRVSEPYSFLWNRNIDAVRLSYDTTTLSGFVAVAENLASYRTSGGDFDGDQQDITNIIGKAGWNIDARNHVELRAIHVNDHSGGFDVGDLVDPTHRDDEDQKLTWGNLRFLGAVPVETGVLTNLSYRLDGAVVGGDVYTTSSSAVVGSDLRTITGETSRNVMGYAFDGTVDLTLAKAPLSPTVSFGYAFGSGDDGNGTDTAFRQPDINGNTSRQGSSGASSHNYGEALRPQLSNLHILKIGVGVPVMSASDMSFIYRDYWLVNEQTGLRNDQLSVNVNGTDSHVGQGLDVIYNMNVDKELPSLQMLPSTNFKVTLGAFKAGDAYDPEDGENVFRGRADLIFKF